MTETIMSQPTDHLVSEMSAQAETLRTDGATKRTEAESLLDQAAKLDAAVAALKGETPPRRRPGRPRKNA